MYTRKHLFEGGSALFAILFGAGNLIFPPLVSHQSGQFWWLGIIGFVCTAVCLPWLSFITASLAEGEAKRIWQRVSPKFAILFSGLIIVIIGPLLVIPRTGATAFEIGILPFLTDTSSIVQLLVKIGFLASYFTLTYGLAIRPTKVIDIVSKLLTPILVIFLVIIILAGVMYDNTTLVSSTIPDVFRFGFFTGYQTMDVFSCLITTSVLISFARAHGADTTKLQFKFIFGSSIIAFLGLAVVYIGLGYVGAMTASTIQLDSTTGLLVAVVEELLGDLGAMVLGIGVIGACLTTAVGITNAFSQYFQKELGVSYAKLVGWSCICSFLISTCGVELIIQIANPILVTIYPVVVVLMLMYLINRYLYYDQIFVGAAVGAGAVGFIESIMGLGFAGARLTQFYFYLPLVDFGLGWLCPAILGGIVGWLVGKYVVTKPTAI